MTLFDSEELVDCLSALAVKKAIFDYVKYDSEIERQFAEELDARVDIKLLVKLASWFKMEAPPLGTTIQIGPL